MGEYGSLKRGEIKIPRAKVGSNCYWSHIYIITPKVR